MTKKKLSKIKTPKNKTHIKASIEPGRFNLEKVEPAPRGETEEEQLGRIMDNLISYGT
jgi:hypothetical protein